MADIRDAPPGTSFGKRKEPLGKRRSRNDKTRQQHQDELWWSSQYKQGRSHESTGSIGCGWCTFSTHDQDFDFKSPWEGKMRIEIMDGGDGDLRLCGPKFWGGILCKMMGEDYGNGLIFMVPFSNLAEILIQKLPKCEGSEDRSRVFIIPTGALGLSAITRHIPQIMDFEMSHVRKRDPYDRGGPSDCVEYLRQACNDRLERYGKRCIDIGEEVEGQLRFPATWTRTSRSKLGEKGKDEGVLHFLPSAVFWQSKEQREDSTPKHIYIPLVAPQSDTNLTLAKNIKLIGHETAGSSTAQPGNAISLHIEGVQYSPVHAKQFKQHPIFTGPRYPTSVVKKLERDNATSSSTVESDLLVFEGLPHQEHERIKAYIQNHYSKVANGSKETKSGAKRSRMTPKKKQVVGNSSPGSRILKRKPLEDLENGSRYNLRNKRTKSSH